MLERHVSSGCSRMRRNFYVGKKKKCGGKQSRQREPYVSQSFRTTQGYRMFIEQGDLHGQDEA